MYISVCIYIYIYRLPWWLSSKNLPTVQETQETQVRSLSQDDPMEKEMGAQCSILVWEIPWTEEPDRLQYLRSQKSWT